MSLLCFLFFSIKVYSAKYIGSGYLDLYPGSYEIICRGAQGGHSYVGGIYRDGVDGGNGSFTKGTLNLNERTRFYLNIGKKGKSCVNGNCQGGANGGGRSGLDTGFSNDDGSGSGGGATDIRIGNNNFANRIMVAAGGSGAAYTCAGASGGGIRGRKRILDCVEVDGTADQINGMENGVGGDGIDNSNVPGSGGGGGWRGGPSSKSGSITNHYKAVAESGSSYISGYTSCTPHSAIQFQRPLSILSGLNPGDGNVVVNPFYVCLDGCSVCANADFCTQCLPNYYLSIDKTKCLTNCPNPGEYPTNGKCALCSSGTYSTGNVNYCFSCPPGTANNQIGQESCKNCTGNSYTSGYRNNECSICRTEGKGVSDDHKSCAYCPPGTFSSELTDYYCVNCQEGYGTNTINSTTCSQCKAGEYSNSLTDHICTHCPGGQSSDPGASQCFLCSKGNYSNAETGYTCQKCPEGLNSGEGSTECGQFDCQGGQRYNNATSKCEDCENGTFGSGTSLFCTDCPDGYSSLQAQTQCSQCPPNTFSDSSTNHLCEPCPEGQYSAEGSSICTKCNNGEFWNLKLDQCDNCPNGTYSNGSLTHCFECEPNTYSDSQLILSNGKCAHCPNGEYSPKGSSKCFHCTPGEYWNYTNFRCEECFPGTFSRNGENIPCNQCTPGFSSDYNASECFKCTNWKYSNSSTNYLCEDCPSGMFASPAEESPIQNDVKVECKECDPVCKECRGSANNCSQCDSEKNYSYYQNNCIKECPEWTYRSNSASQYGDYQCIDCTKPCKSCLFESCLSCIDSYYLLGERCVNETECIGFSRANLHYNVDNTAKICKVVYTDIFSENIENSQQIHDYELIFLTLILYSVENEIDFLPWEYET